MAASGRSTSSRGGIVGAAAMAFAAGGGAHASPWARPDGELLVIAKSDYFSADLAAQGSPNGAFQRLDADTYVEFGLTDHVTLGGKAIYSTAWLTRPDNAETRSGFSQIEIFAQHEVLRDDRHAASLRVAAARTAPVISGASGGLIGDGADLEIAALYGRNFTQAPVKLFAAADIGYRRRFGAAADQMRAQATIGVEPHRRVLFLVEGFATYSLRNEDLGGADYDIVKIQPSLVVKFSPSLAVQAGASKDVASRHVARGHSFFIGMWSAF